MASVDAVNLSPLVKSFLAGSLSGTCSTILFQPLDLVKTRLQTTNHSQLAVGGGRDGMIGVVHDVVKTENVFGLWRGMMPSMLRCVPGVGLYFSSMHLLKTATQPEDGSSMGPMHAVAVGAGARTISGVLMIPMTVVKTRFESGTFKYSGVTNAVKTIYTTEGVKGLACGLVPTLLRDAPFSGLYLMFYTQLKSQMTTKIPQEWREGSFNTSVLLFGCGVSAGLFASAVTQPFDVCKTRMQVDNKEFRTMTHALYKILQAGGYKALFDGLAPRMLRRTLMAAMAWTVYENVMSNLHLK